MLTNFLFFSYKLAAIKLVTPSKEHLETHCSYPYSRDTYEATPPCYPAEYLLTGL